MHDLKALDFINSIRAALPDCEDISIHLQEDGEVMVLWSKGGQLYTLPHEMEEATDPRALVWALAVGGNVGVEA